MKQENGSGSRRICVIAMPSLTYALQGEALLGGAGFPLSVIKLPAGATKKGCSYGLQVECRRLEEAVRRLEARGIRHGELIR